MVSIGDKLAELKEFYGNEAELANALCIGQGTVNKYINNKLPVPFDLVMNIPKMIKRKDAKDKALELTIEWKARFDEMFIRNLLTI